MNDKSRENPGTPGAKFLSFSKESQDSVPPYLQLAVQKLIDLILDAFSPGPYLSCAENWAHQMQRDSDSKTRHVKV